MPEYASLIADSAALAALREMRADGDDILILDNDAPPRETFPHGREMTQATWDEAIADASLPFGHGYVVAALLAGDVCIQ